MSFEPTRSAPLLIDFQARLMPQIAEAENALANACRLGEAARLLDVPVLATEQNPDGLGPNVPAIRALAGATLAKTFFDATREDAWAGFLPPVAGGNGRRDLVVAGCETHVCVLQTVLGLLDKGHRVRLAADAVGSRTTRNREAALHRAERRGAELVTTEMVVFEWLARSDHLCFRDLLKLVK